MLIRLFSLLVCSIQSHVGLKTISYETVPAEQAEARMEKVRRDYGYEGEVLYFVDGRDNVIGLLKKKTAWYVVSRALREKTSHMVNEFRKNPHSFDQGERKRERESTQAAVIVIVLKMLNVFQSS